MYSITHNQFGEIQSIELINADSSITSFAPTGILYETFLAWNALQDPPLSLDPIEVQVVKSEVELISDFLSFGTPEERGLLWITLVRKFGLTNDISRGQFDADPVGFISNPIINDIVTPRILEGIKQDPEGLIAALAAVEITYDPYVS